MTLSSKKKHVHVLMYLREAFSSTVKRIFDDKFETQPMPTLATLLLRIIFQNCFLVSRVLSFQCTHFGMSKNPRQWCVHIPYVLNY